MANEIETIVRDVVRLLVGGDYDVIEKITEGRRLSAGDMQNAIEIYGRRLAMPPESAFTQLLDAVRVENSKSPQWLVEMPLWTREEGRSDLSLELTITRGDDKFDIQVDDIHVL